MVRANQEAALELIKSHLKRKATCLWAGRILLLFLIRPQYCSNYFCVYEVLKSRIDTYLALLVCMFPLWMPFENNFSSIVTTLPIHYHRAPSFEPSYVHKNMSIGYKMRILPPVMVLLDYPSLFVLVDSPLPALSCYDTFIQVIVRKS